MKVTKLILALFASCALSIAAFANSGTSEKQADGKKCEKSCEKECKDGKKADKSCEKK